MFDEIKAPLKYEEDEDEDENDDDAVLQDAVDDEPLADQGHTEDEKKRKLDDEAVAEQPPSKRSAPSDFELAALPPVA
jgi:hypothetical protein